MPSEENSTWNGAWPDAPVTTAAQPPNRESKRDVKPISTRRRTFKEQRELTDLPRRIEALETERNELTTSMSSPEFFQRDKVEIARATKRLDEIEAELMTCFERWELLETLAE